MADYATVLIAAITAGAGLGGGLIAGRFNLKALVMSHRRDDAVSIRAKVEELYAELDHIENMSAEMSAQVMNAIGKQDAPAERFQTINLGKVRAIVALYFPACQPAFEAFDQRSTENARLLRASLEKKDRDPSFPLYEHVLLESQSRQRLCGELREFLGKEAEQLGKAIRLNAEADERMEVSRKQVPAITENNRRSPRE